MWDTVMANASSRWEPIELQSLKRELAKLECNCNTCESYKEVTELRENSYCNDAAIQVETHNGPLDRFIYGNSNQYSPGTSEPATNNSNMMGYFRNDLFCPNCLFIWDLIRGLKKVLKDEESETRHDMFSSDKSTDNKVEFADSTTSLTNKPVPRSSNLTLCDSIAESTSNTDAVMTSTHTQFKRNQDRVTFTGDYDDDYRSCLKKPLPPPLQGTCFCLQKLVDSIRPPLRM